MGGGNGIVDLGTLTPCNLNTDADNQLLSYTDPGFYKFKWSDTNIDTGTHTSYLIVTPIENTSTTSSTMQILIDGGFDIQSIRNSSSSKGIHYRILYGSSRAPQSWIPLSPPSLFTSNKGIATLGDTEFSLDGNCTYIAQIGADITDLLENFGESEYAELWIMPGFYFINNSVNLTNILDTKIIKGIGDVQITFGTTSGKFYLYNTEIVDLVFENILFKTDNSVIYIDSLYESSVKFKNCRFSKNTTGTSVIKLVETGTSPGCSLLLDNCKASISGSNTELYIIDGSRIFSSCIISNCDFTATDIFLVMDTVIFQNNRVGGNLRVDDLLSNYVFNNYVSGSVTTGENITTFNSATVTNNVGPNITNILVEKEI